MFTCPDDTDVVARTRLSRMPSVSDINNTMSMVTRNSAAPRKAVRRRAASRFWTAMDSAIIASLLALHGHDRLDAGREARRIKRRRDADDDGRQQAQQQVGGAHG